MEAKDIRTLQDANRYFEGCLNDYEHGIMSKEETMTAFFDFAVKMNNLHIEKVTELVNEIEKCSFELQVGVFKDEALNKYKAIQVNQVKGIAKKYGYNEKK